MNHFSLSLLFLTVGAIGCKKDDTVVKLTNVSCAPEAPVLREVKDTEAVVAFVAAEQQYALVVGNSRGIIYQQDYGVVCNLPVAFREEGKRVRFNGIYKEYTGPAVLKKVGETYSYLDLRKLEAL